MLPQIIYVELNLVSDFNTCGGCYPPFSMITNHK